MIEVPEELAAKQFMYGGEAGRAFIAVLPERAAEFLGRWELTRSGPAMHGWCALVLPVVRRDGSQAVLKLQALDEESVGEPVALRVWDGAGAVRLLDHDPGTGTMLLERLGVRRGRGMRPVRGCICRLSRMRGRRCAFWRSCWCG